jgi:hypothetical protein
MRLPVNPMPGRVFDPRIPARLHERLDAPVVPEAARIITRKS